MSGELVVNWAVLFGSRMTLSQDSNQLIGIQMSFTAFVLCILRLFKLKTVQYTEKLQNQNFCLSWVSLIVL